MVTSVAERCSQISPSTSQAHNVCTIADGLIIHSFADEGHGSISREPRMSAMRRIRSAAMPAGCESTRDSCDGVPFSGVSLASCCSAVVNARLRERLSLNVRAFRHFVFQLVPQLLVQLRKLRRKPQFEDVPR